MLVTVIIRHGHIVGDFSIQLSGPSVLMIQLKNRWANLGGIEEMNYTLLTRFRFWLKLCINNGYWLKSYARLSASLELYSDGSYLPFMTTDTVSDKCCWGVWTTRFISSDWTCRNCCTLHTYTGVFIVGRALVCVLRTMLLKWISKKSGSPGGLMWTR